MKAGLEFMKEIGEAEHRDHRWNRQPPPCQISLQVWKILLALDCSMPRHRTGKRNRPTSATSTRRDRSCRFRRPTGKGWRQSSTQPAHDQFARVVP